MSEFDEWLETKEGRGMISRCGDLTAVHTAFNAGRQCRLQKAGPIVWFNFDYSSGFWIGGISELDGFSGLFRGGSNPLHQEHGESVADVLTKLQTWLRRYAGHLLKFAETIPTAVATGIDDGGNEYRI